MVWPVDPGNWRSKAAALKQNILALYFTWKHPGTPFLARWIIGLTVAYALSPIDLIPDFIPVLGYIDDLVILPIGIWMAIRLVPPEIWQASRERAANEATTLGRNMLAAVAVVLIWLLVGLWLSYFLWTNWPLG